MKKRMILIALVLVCALALSACGCKHETWLDADCVTPKTCAQCGETEGAPLGHTWAAATCETPKTCQVCSGTEGEALGHSWVEADCENARTCSACSLTEGEALGHTWLEATTEAPKTCEACGSTEGERISTDARFTTAACQELFGTWTGEMVMTGTDMGEPLDQYIDEMDVAITLELHNDGTMVMTVLPKDTDVISQVMQDLTVDMMYQEFASMGLSAADANAAMTEVYGMSIEEYVAAAVAEMDFTDLFSQVGVYYVEDGLCYIGNSWDEQMEGDSYVLEGDTLTLPIDSDTITLTRVAE